MGPPLTINLVHFYKYIVSIYVHKFLKGNMYYTRNNDSFAALRP